MNNIRNDFQIVAVDFDGTLCVDSYPNIGAPNQKLIRQLREWQLQQKKLILWTCRNGQFLTDAVSWCANQGLTFDAVNENLPEIVEKYGSDSRKITADIYIDDRSCLPWESASDNQIISIAV